MKISAHRPEDRSTINRALADVEPEPFGRFLPAVSRWSEVLGVEAPSPSTENRNGDPQLSSRFAEWFMGFPPGWVTGAGVSRTNQLKALGNAVVPQQGAEALKRLRVELENEN